jgi:hypothetical protein
MQVGEANRAAALGLYGAQAQVAGGMGQIETAYQYDPGLEYIKSIGYGAGSAVPAPVNDYAGPHFMLERYPKGGGATAQAIGGASAQQLKTPFFSTGKSSTSLNPASMLGKVKYKGR